MPSIKLDIPEYFLQFDKKQVKKALRGAAQVVKKDAQALIRKSVAAGTRYGNHTASAPGQPPSSETGRLASSIVVKSSRGLTVRVIDRQFYALALEAGAVGGGGRAGERSSLGVKQGSTRKGTAGMTRVMAPRPYLSLALEQDAPELKRRIELSVMDCVSWKETK